MNNRIASFTGLRGKLRYREPMSKHTTWRVGGPADCFYQPADREDLCDFMAQLPPVEPVFWLGLGSNLLVRDGGIRGTVICTAGRLDGYRFIGDVTIRIEAGMPCARVARITAQAGYAGAEFMAGVPGAPGGGLGVDGGGVGGGSWTLV